VAYFTQLKQHFDIMSRQSATNVVSPFFIYSVAVVWKLKFKEIQIQTWI